MKELLLILIVLPMIGFGQLTMIPDANFEQKLINLGYDSGAINGSVYTANINTVTSLAVNYQNISDLTGIEDFTALTSLNCNGNQLTSIDVSANLALMYLGCDGNQLTSIDLSQNTALISLGFSGNQLTSIDLSQNTALDHLECEYNQLTSLDVSNNTAIEELWCGNNQLTSLDVSNNTALGYLTCENNQLTSLDVSNNTSFCVLICSYNQLTSLDVRIGNNSNWAMFSCTSNPLLNCINVDDVPYWYSNWSNTIDPQHYFSNNCSGTSVEEHSTNKELLKVTDLLGRETKGTKNDVLFYIYDDGTVEKKIILK